MTRDLRHMLALDLGGTSLKGRAVRLDGTLGGVRTWPTPQSRTSDTVLPAVLAALRELDDDDGDLTGIAVAVPGLLDEERGVVELASSLGWRHLPLADLVMADFGVPAVVVQDTDAAGRAEAVADPGLEGSFAFLALGTGIGSTTLADGAVRRGRNGHTGELGHVQIGGSDRLCRCGATGCVETLASGWAIRDRYAELTGNALDVRDIVSRLREDRAAAQVWDDACRALGAAVAALVLIADPGPVVLGGGLSLAGPHLLERVQASMFRTSPLVASADLRLSVLGDRGCLAGAVLAAQGLVPQSPDAPLRY